MSSALLTSYIESVKNPDAQTIPVIMDDTHVFAVLTEITGHPITDYTSIATLGCYQVSVFDIPPEKKQFDIATVRQVIDAMSLRPYQGKHIFILRNFHTAKDAAQNATLKMLEECPNYAVVILVAPTTASFLETILSRTMVLMDARSHISIHPTTRSLIERALMGDLSPWMAHLYQTKYSRDEAIGILHMVYPHIHTSMKSKVFSYMIALWSTTENPCNILDAVFLSQSPIFEKNIP